MQTNFYYKVKILKRVQPVKDTDCVHIGVSVNNPSHQGKKLETLLKWASEKYKHVHVDVHDSIQYHNLMSMNDISESKARILAIKEGDDWLSANEKILSSFPKVKISRRDTIIKQFPQYKNRLTQLKSLYASSVLFRELVDKETYNFYNRKEKQNYPWPKELKNKIIFSSTEYLLDELALMSLLNEEKSFVEIYAGSFLDILNNPKRLDIEGLPEGLKSYPLIEVDFVRKSEEPKHSSAA